MICIYLYVHDHDYDRIARSSFNAFYFAIVIFMSNL